MQKLIIVSLLSVVVMTQGFAQISYNDIFDNMAVKVNPAKEQATIKWDSLTKCDFGTIQSGAEVFYEFKFTNTSTEPIRIDNVNISGASVIPSWENKPVLPHQIGTIKVIFNAGQPGKFNKIIKVRIQNIRQSETLYIKGKVV